MKQIIELSQLSSGAENSKLLQDAVDKGGEISVMTPGVYKLTDTIMIGDHTHLYFAPGVYIEREPREDGMNGYAFINKGAYTGEENCDISIEGLYLSTRGVESTHPAVCSKNIPGLRAHVCFVYIRDLVLRNITVLELNEKDYGVQISDFRNVLVEYLRVEGNKDGIHFGPGKGFVVRHAVFRTFDDPVALNGSDYSTSNPHIGWIEDGLIEDAYDLADDDTTGFFARLLAGAWVDWFSGMEVQHSDAVVHNGKIYRVCMPPDGRKFISNTPPTHESGYAELDGICWCCQQNDTPYSGGCRNITFRNIYLQKKRLAAFGLEMDDFRYLRSYYPGAVIPVQSGIKLKNIYVQGEIEHLIRDHAPLGDITIENCDMKNTNLFFTKRNIPGLEYPVCKIKFKNVRSNGAPIVGDIDFEIEQG